METTTKHKVLLADDHILLRDALANVINTFSNFEVSGLAANGKEVQKLLQDGTAADIILLDLSMPLMDGYETAAWLADNYPEIKILVLSIHNNDIILARLLRQGINGFLKKDCTPAVLKTALEAIGENGCYFSADTNKRIAALLKKDKNAASALEKNTLSETEMAFLKLVSSDMTYKEIALGMHLSLRTVESCREDLFEKLGVQSRTGLAVYAVKNGMV